MDCRGFESLLDALVGGECGAADRADADAHRATCARCAHLYSIVSAPGAPAADDALVAAILRRTVGSICQPAQADLPAWTDGALAPGAAGLVAMHLESCADCAALAAALVALGRDLPELAEVAPDPGFVADALARTRPRRRSASWAVRWRELRQRMLLRPRLAWELATGACLVLTPLFGLPASPLRGMPRHAVAAVQFSPFDASRAAARLGPLWRGPLQAAWHTTRGRVAGWAGDARAVLSDRGHTAAAIWPRLRADGTALAVAIPSRDPERVAQAARALGADLATLWRGTRAGALPETGGRRE